MNCIVDYSIGVIKVYECIGDIIIVAVIVSTNTVAIGIGTGIVVDSIVVVDVLQEVVGVDNVDSMVVTVYV